jgi:hypothetical protein
MVVRQFDWRDLPTLRRYRRESVFLDSTLLLTRGSQQITGALFSYLAPSLGIFTCVSNGETSPDGRMIGQFIHPAGSPFSHLTFLAPLAALESCSISALVEYMMALSGERGALRLLADVDEQSGAFEALHRCGFVVYSRQCIWQLDGQPTSEPPKHTWRLLTDLDMIPVRNLYNNLVPGLVQQIEPFAQSKATLPKAALPIGMVYYQNGELLAFVELKYGPRGIWVQPFIHPDTEDVQQVLLDLLNKIPDRRSRPVYICVRSYQAWLELAIDELGGKAGPRQAVMARQLVTPQRVERMFALPALEGGQAEAPAPLSSAAAHLESK